MDHQTLSSVLFLSSLTSLGCAQGTDSEFVPAPYGPSSNGRGSDGDAPHTDPFETTGSDPSQPGNDSQGTNPGSGEGETGNASDGSTTGDASPSETDGDSETAGGEGETGIESSSTGDYGDYGSTGDYGESGSPPAGGPCPNLAQLYSDCVAEYTYDSEIALCEQSVSNAQNISPACGTAHSEYLACLSTLDCGTLLGEGVPFPCLIQDGLAVFHCGG